MALCFACGNEIDRKTAVGRSSTCDSCGAELKVCLNCRHYDPAAAYQCREPIQEPVPDKDRGNFCDHFQLPLPGEAVRGVTPGTRDPKVEKARRSFDALFGDG
ncbi:hypothetical protein [Spirochaeta africana]|uniref:Uncharacterized protein n=1 Tax=Spirochaeta africana (strain ATCC 700263 / DSM 8902 / Z-7692) TaxID=889378 RepID=H9UJL8_SPIAZ|nr:hypothetical protein [Spirochaeta africana]AFG37711.1 hypothetical protein Spiaf_1653 [Spirochaeta africana DSM 8902]